MIRIEHVLEIERGPEEVFDYLTDVESLPEWQASATDVRADDDPITVGSRFHEVRSVLGRNVESTLEVTEYERPRRFSARVVDGPVPYEVRHAFEEIDGGTRLTFSGETEAGGLFKVAEPVAARTAERRVVADLKRLKEVLEARPG